MFLWSKRAFTIIIVSIYIPRFQTKAKAKFPTILEYGACNYLFPNLSIFIVASNFK